MPTVDLREALRRFAERMRSAYSVAGAAGDPEDQLKPLVKDLLEACPGVAAQTEIRIDEGRPDVGAYANGALVGLIEFREPGKDVASSLKNPRRLHVRPCGKAEAAVWRLSRTNLSRAMVMNVQIGRSMVLSNPGGP